MRRLSSRRVRGSIYSRPSSNPFRMARPSYTPIEFTSRYTPIEGIADIAGKAADTVKALEKKIQGMSTSELHSLKKATEALAVEGPLSPVSTATLTLIDTELERRSKRNAKIMVAGGVLAGAFLLFKK